MGLPQNGWSRMETPINMDDLGVPPILGNLQMVANEGSSKPCFGRYKESHHYKLLRN
jgi:hypothetical protein